MAYLLTSRTSSDRPRPLQYRLRQLEINSMGLIVHLRVSPLNLVHLVTTYRRIPSFTQHAPCMFLPGRELNPKHPRIKVQINQISPVVCFFLNPLFLCQKHHFKTQKRYIFYHTSLIVKHSPWPNPKSAATSRAGAAPERILLQAQSIGITHAPCYSPNEERSRPHGDAPAGAD